MIDLPPSAADTVHQDLRDRILRGELAPGASLPGERKLAESFGINRGSVREALQRLAQAKLIEVHHGGATRVLDYREAGLDLLGDLMARPGQVDLVLIRSVLEMRNALVPVLARLAARRGGVALADALAAEVDGLVAGTTDHVRYQHMRAVWRLLAHGAGNLALRLALNSMQQGTARYEDKALLLLGAELRDPGPYRALVAAVRSANEDAAAEAATALVAPTVRLAEQLLGR